MAMDYERALPRSTTGAVQRSRPAGFIEVNFKHPHFDYKSIFLGNVLKACIQVYLW